VVSWAVGVRSIFVGADADATDQRATRNEERTTMKSSRILTRAVCLTVILIGARGWVTSQARASDGPLTWSGDVDAGADKTLRPIVFVHGFAGSGEQYERPAKLFESNGYPPTWINVYDYNSMGATGGAEPLDKFIDAVRARTGFDKIDLVGHSRGTGVSKDYLSDPKRAAKVAHYANIAGRAAGNEGGVPTIVIGSKGDKIAGPGTARNGAQHAVLEKPDHVGAATGTESFEHVFSFFNGGKAPKTLDVRPREPIAVGGFAKYFGPNAPVAGGTVEIFEVAADTGRRMHPQADAKFTVGDDGRWGPFRAQPGQHYELCLTAPGAKRPVHYYREPFERTDLLVYLKTRDPKAADTERLEKGLSLSDDSSTMIVSQLNGAIVAGRDSLKVNGIELATDKIAPESGTKVGFYVFDANQNKKTDAALPDGAMWRMPFITAADVYVPTTKPETITFELNGRVLHAPNWKGNSEGTIFVTFN
jgi:pimeloyl-ACP methyl ester carboxylesterase